MDNENLKRIADALEEILRLVKQDMERMKKLNEEPEEGDMRDHFTKAQMSNEDIIELPEDLINKLNKEG